MASFPVVLETYRECLQDVFDLPALKQILRGLKTRELDLVDVETPSHRRTRLRCSSTTSRRTCTRTTRLRPSGAPRRCPSTATCCASCWGRRSSATCSMPTPWRTWNGNCSATPARRRAPRPASAYRAPAEGRVRARAGGAAPARAARRRSAGRGRGRAGRRRGRRALQGRARGDAAGRPPLRVPRGSRRAAFVPPPSVRPLRAARSRRARRPRASGSSRSAAEELAALERAGSSFAASSARAARSGNGATRTFFGACAGPRSPRSGVRSSPPSSRARPLPARWQGVDRRAATLREALVPLQALPLPVALWESEPPPASRPGLPSRRSSTSSAPRARWSGSGPASTGSPSTSATTPRPWAGSGGAERPKARCTAAA